MTLVPVGCASLAALLFQHNQATPIGAAPSVARCWTRSSTCEESRPPGRPPPAAGCQVCRAWATLYLYPSRPPPCRLPYLVLGKRMRGVDKSPFLRSHSIRQKCPQDPSACNQHQSVHQSVHQDPTAPFRAPCLHPVHPVGSLCTSASCVSPDLHNCAACPQVPAPW